MAQRTIYYCDFPVDSGTHEVPSTGKIVVIVNGVHHAGEYCDEHRTQIRDWMLSELGMTVTEQPKQAKYRTYVTKSGVPYTALEARHWAIEQGIEVPKGGRLPGEVLDAYAAAH